MVIKDNKDALEKFIFYSKAYSDLQGKENHKSLNKYFDKIAKCAGFLNKHNALTELKPLLKDTNSGVVAWASYYYLTIDSSLALNNFRKLSEANIPFISSEAKGIISDWNNGDLEVFFNFNSTLE